MKKEYIYYNNLYLNLIWKNENNKKLGLIFQNV